MNTTNWYYSEGQQTYGPFAAEQIAALIQSGLLTRDHLVVPEGSEDWQPLGVSVFAAYLPQVAAPAPQTQRPGGQVYRPPQAKQPAPVKSRAHKPPAPNKGIPVGAIVVVLVIAALAGGYFWKQQSSTVGFPKATKETPFINSLGMQFVPVPGTDVLMCIHETRVQDYAAYAQSDRSVHELWKNPVTYVKGNKVALATDPKHPVVNMTAYDAMGFCEWLSRKEGLIYRLPTDHEWCIAGGFPEDPNISQSRDFRMQDHVSATQMEQWEKEMKAYGERYDREKMPHYEPVMSWPPNTLGIHDLADSVVELCHGRMLHWERRENFVQYYIPGTITNFSKTRGGAFGSPRFEAGGAGPDEHREFFGFRIVIANKPLTPADDEPPEKMEGVLSYEPKKLKIVNKADKGWLLTDGEHGLQLLDNEGDAKLALAMAIEHTQRRIIGRGPYAFECWLGDSGLTGGPKTSERRTFRSNEINIHHEDAPNLGMGYWGFEGCQLGSEAHAVEALALARQHPNFNIIGGGNKRDNNLDYRMVYWE